MSQKLNRVTPYPLRMPPDLREWYEGEAKRNSRSLSGELLKLLTERMNRAKGKRVNDR